MHQPQMLTLEWGTKIAAAALLVQLPVALSAAQQLALSHVLLPPSVGKCPLMPIAVLHQANLI